MSKPTHVLIDRDTLEKLVAVAIAAFEDLEDGLETGIFLEDAIGGVDGQAVFDAIETAQAVLK